MLEGFVLLRLAVAVCQKRECSLLPYCPRYGRAIAHLLKRADGFVRGLPSQLDNTVILFRPAVWIWRLAASFPVRVANLGGTAVTAVLAALLPRHEKTPQKPMFLVQNKYSTKGTACQSV